jgi:small subunit ribosomal protein S17
MAETTQETPPQAEHTHEEGRGFRRKLTGRIVSDTHKPGRAKKTVVVEVQRRYRDPVYGKYIKSRKRYHAHDEKEQFRTHDEIEIEESRPISATKRWVAIRLINRPEEV